MEAPPSSDVQIKIDPGETFQTTEGWGTSLCWFANVIGGWSAQKRTEIADLFFDEEKGLGLNVVRYNIGGGEAPGHNHMGTGREIPGFKATEASNYDFSADPRQVQMLQDAIERIPSDDLIIEAFSNSPPYWMTQSGCAAGAQGGGDNLKADYYDDFADYLSDVTLHFRDELDITFRTVEPLNEPNGTWWTEGNGQEGCHFDRPSQAKIIKELRASLDERGLSEVEVSAPDETSIDDTVASYKSYDATTKGIVKQINTHAYHGSQRAELRALATQDGKRLWSSEIDGSGAPAPFDEHLHGHDDMISGLDLAQRIVRDLRGMQIDAFVFWQSVESEQGQIDRKKNWGLLHARFEGSSEEYFVTKKYHVMRQYSAFIRPGDVMIGIDDQESVAFINAAEGKLVIVKRNASTMESKVNFDLTGFSRLQLSGVRRTSGGQGASENFEELELIPITQGQLVATIAPQSVTTFVFDCVVAE